MPIKLTAKDELYLELFGDRETIEAIKEMEAMPKQELEAYMQKNIPDYKTKREQLRQRILDYAADQLKEDKKASITTKTQKIINGVFKAFREGVDDFMVSITPAGLLGLQNTFAPTIMNAAGNSSEINRALAENEVTVVPVDIFSEGNDLLVYFQWLGASPASAPKISAFIPAQWDDWSSEETNHCLRLTNCHIDKRLLDDKGNNKPLFSYRYDVANVVLFLDI